MRVLGVNAVRSKRPVPFSAQELTEPSNTSVDALAIRSDPPPYSNVVADDRRDATSAQEVPATTAPLVVVRTNGRGPAASGGFDERFFRAFREVDLGLCIVRAGYAMVWGERVTTHPLASPNSWRYGLTVQAENAENALLRANCGRRWGSLIGSCADSDWPSPNHHRRRDCDASGYVFRPRRGAACPRRLASRRGGGGLCVGPVDDRVRRDSPRHEGSAMAVSPGAGELVSRHFDALATAPRQAASAAPVIQEWGQHLAAVFAAGGKLLVCGNGGGAAEAQHLTGELLGRFEHERQPLPSIALSADSSAVTAIVNDYGAEELFARQVQAHGRRGDVLVALSTSGISPNVIAAAKAGLDLGVTVWALTGPAPNPLATVSDSAIAVDAPTGATVQEIHLCLFHALCLALDEALQVRTA